MIRSNTLSEVMVIASSIETVADCGVAAVAAATSPSLRTISRGSSGLPVVLAGHTDVHRPHTVQASVSSSCFHVNSATMEAPTVSMSSASIRFGISRIAPTGRVFGERYMLAGEVIMCRSLVLGRTTRNATKLTTCVTQRTW